MKANAFFCPHCDKKYPVRAHEIPIEGVTIKCRGCNFRFRLQRDLETEPVVSKNESSNLQQNEEDRPRSMMQKVFAKVFAMGLLVVFVAIPLLALGLVMGIIILLFSEEGLISSVSTKISNPYVRNAFLGGTFSVFSLIGGYVSRSGGRRVGALVAETIAVCLAIFAIANLIRWALSF